MDFASNFAFFGSMGQTDDRALHARLRNLSSDPGMRIMDVVCVVNRLMIR
jgi:hypothetical protein